MKAPLSKVALAVVLLNSSIYVSTDSEDVYMEDDSSFTSISEALKVGWHWGSNNANACDNRSCENGDDYERFPVNGTTIDGGFGDFGGADYEDGGTGGGSEPGESGGSGGNGSEADESSRPSEREVCLNRVQLEFENCEYIAFDNHNHESGLCQDMAHDPDASYEDIEECENEMMYRFNHDVEQCSLRLDDDVRICHAHFSN